MSEKAPVDPAIIKSMFEGSDDLEVPDNSGNFNSYPQVECNGHFQVRLLNVGLNHSQKWNAHYYSVDYEIVQTDADNQEMHPVGAKRNWRINISNVGGRDNRKQLSVVKGFIAAAAGIPAKDARAKAITQDTMMQSFDESQPLKGALLNLRTSGNVVSTFTKREFTAHHWTPAA